MNKAIFDTETTGPDKAKDRIVQLAIKIIDENGNILSSKSKLYNPEMPISPAATETHGITDEMVKNAPTFKEDAKKLKKIFEECVLVGYNIIQFDIPIIMAEYDRVGVDLELSNKVIDVMRLETSLNPRTLGAVYKRYTGQAMDNAHDALADVIGTEVVLEHQLFKIKNEGLNEQELMAACGIPENAADFFGKFVYDDQKYLVYNFGKHQHLRVLANDDTRKYASWMLGESFPGQVKKLLQAELKKDVASQFKRQSPVMQKSDVIDSKPGSQGFYPITQQMITTRNRTGKSFEEQQAEKTGFSFKAGVQGKLINDDSFSDDLPF